eukprot:6192795-Pleurochrysis_carterae.AAC.2
MTPRDWGRMRIAWSLEEIERARLRVGRTKSRQASMEKSALCAVSPDILGLTQRARFATLGRRAPQARGLHCRRWALG